MFLGKQCDKNVKSDSSHVKSNAVSFLYNVVVKHQNFKHVLRKVVCQSVRSTWSWKMSLASGLRLEMCLVFSYATWHGKVLVWWNTLSFRHVLWLAALLEFPSDPSFSQTSTLKRPKFHSQLEIQIWKPTRIISQHFPQPFRRSQGMHSLRFTTSRIPMAVALTDGEVLVDQGSSIRWGCDVYKQLGISFDSLDNFIEHFWGQSWSQKDDTELLDIFGGGFFGKRTVLRCCGCEAGCEVRAVCGTSTARGLIGRWHVVGDPKKDRLRRLFRFQGDWHDVSVWCSFFSAVFLYFNMFFHIFSMYFRCISRGCILYGNIVCFCLLPVAMDAHFLKVWCIGPRQFGVALWWEAQQIPTAKQLVICKKSHGFNILARLHVAGFSCLEKMVPSFQIVMVEDNVDFKFHVFWKTPFFWGKIGSQVPEVWQIPARRSGLCPFPPGCDVSQFSTPFGMITHEHAILQKASSKVCFSSRLLYIEPQKSKKNTNTQLSTSHHFFNLFG